MQYKGLIISVLTFLFISLLAIFLLAVFAYILFKIYTKLSEYNRKKKDFLYDMFLRDDMQCHVNRDQDMKFRNWKLLWMFWKRKSVLLNTSEGYKYVGEYSGECSKKEDYYLIAITNKITSFKRLNQVIMIPFSMKNKLIRKVTVDGTKTLIIDAEGVDSIGNTDYYLIPLIKNPKKESEFIDFADDIHKKYFEKTIYRDIIKENLQQYRQGVITSVETNPYIHFGRRKEKQE